jgi:N-methylhydantoinase B/oxoprolinase/acetone carboxylase alpha subunit
MNLLDGVEIASKVSLKLKPKQRLTILTPGGGGWGEEY